MVLPFVSGCAFGRLKPGLTKEGAAVDVVAPTVEEARRLAVTNSLELFLAPASTSSARITAAFGARAAEFTGRARFKNGGGVVELRFGRLLSALDKEGLLRPAGFPSRHPRVLILVSEPQGILDLGVGPAADALRRGLNAYGMTAIDGRDQLNNFLANGHDPAALAAGASKLGAEWLIVAAASASAELDPVSGTWRGRATLIADQYAVASASSVGQTQSDASVLDTSSAAARGRALDETGADAAAKVAAEIGRRRAGRSEGAVFVIGASGVDSLKGFISAVRRVEGVEGAHLAIWRGDEDSVILRVFLAGLGVDGLAARLLRSYPSLTLMGVETESGRLAVQLPGGRDL